jgi:hypothetical protein
VFAAVFTSVVGHAAGLGAPGSHAWLRWRTGGPVTAARYQSHPMYRWIVVWCLVSPLVWTIPGIPDFVTLTLAANGGQVVLLPLLAGGLWWITASSRHIGPAHRNRRWENLVFGLLFVLAVYGAFQSVGMLGRSMTRGL